MCTSTESRTRSCLLISRRQSRQQSHMVFKVHCMLLSSSLNKFELLKSNKTINAQNYADNIIQRPSNLNELPRNIIAYLHQIQMADLVCAAGCFSANEYYIKFWSIQTWDTSYYKFIFTFIFPNINAIVVAVVAFVSISVTLLLRKWIINEKVVT